MDCRDAQFFLRFRRPGSPGDGELAPEDAAALDQHLAGCTACSADARFVSAFDKSLGTAMRAVEVPSGLRERLIASTSAERGGILRRRAYRYTALAASVLVAIGLAAGIFTANRPTPDTYELASQPNSLEHVHFDGQVIFNQADQAEATRAAVSRWLKAERLPELPDTLASFDYNLLVSYHLEDVKGRQVPVLLFRGREQGFAKVYAFRATQFNLKNVQGASTSNCQAEVFATDHALGVTFVVVYTGRDLSQFTKGRAAGGPVALLRL